MGKFVKKVKMKKKLAWLGAAIGGVNYLWYHDQNYTIKSTNTEQNRKLREQLEPLLSSFVASPFLAFSPLIQNIYFGIVHKEPFPYYYDREYIKLEDDGQITIDWVEGYSEETEKELKEKKKLMVIIHGLTGASESSYVKAMAKEGIRN